jgi:hypothetical protein
MAKHNFTLTGRKGLWEVKISPTTSYGYYEHDLRGEGGGLWFENGELVDFDGYPCLPHAVADAIVALGYVVDKESCCV